MKRIEATASLLPAYRRAEAIVMADAEKQSPHGTASLPRHDDATFTAAEIGDQIVSTLDRRIAMMTKELRNLASKPRQDCARLSRPLSCRGGYISSRGSRTGTDRPAAPVRDGCLRALPLCHLEGVGLPR
jgi:hypothetical protein